MIIDAVNSLSFTTILYYPTHQMSQPSKVGPYLIELSKDAPIASGSFPLIILSHGNSSTPLVYRTISTYLAKSGFIVAGVEHYGNNRSNNSLEKSPLNLEYRPLHVSQSITQLLANAFFSQSINKERISVIGHSFGGYTALAVAGGVPYMQTGHKIPVKKDGRVKSIVIMAPAAAYFMPENALSEVDLPILLLTAEHDNFTPPSWSSDIVLRGVQDLTKIQHKQIKNAGHFSFLSPFPKSMCRPDFLPSTDPEGFNRAKFHVDLCADILLF